MTATNFKVITISVVGFCVLVCLVAFTSFQYIEFNTATNWALEYFALPILFIMIPTCSLSYMKFIRKVEIQQFGVEPLSSEKTIFRIMLFTVGMTAIFFATTISFIILTNAYLGESKKIELSATILKYNATKRRGRTNHYIQIKDQTSDRIIDLKVYRPYTVGETFQKPIKIGKWGLLYSEN